MHAKLYLKSESNESATETSFIKSMLDISHVSDQRQKTNSFRNLNIFVKILVIFALFFALISGASAIPGCVSLKSNNAFLKVFQRQLVTLPLLGIVSMVEIKVYGNTEFKYRDFFAT